MSDARYLDAYALLFEYPAADVIGAIESACGHLEAAGLQPGEGARRLRELLQDAGPDRAEEHFTQVFDVNAARSLEMGWHLYGEDYARGAFLVRMRQALREVGVEEGSELPDCLPTLLRLLARLPSGKAAIFSTSYLQPALERMLAGFEDSRSPYGAVVQDLMRTLESVYGPTRSAEAPIQSAPYEAAAPCSPSPNP